jgi:hypothetical protein
MNSTNGAATALIDLHMDGDDVNQEIGGFDVFVRGNPGDNYRLNWSCTGAATGSQSETGNAYQDMKFESQGIVASGILADHSGEIDWLDFPSFRLRRRLKAGQHRPYDCAYEGYTKDKLTI